MRNGERIHHEIAVQEQALSQHEAEDDLYEPHELVRLALVASVLSGGTPKQPTPLVAFRSVRVRGPHEPSVEDYARRTAVALPGNHTTHNAEGRPRQEIRKYK